MGAIALIKKSTNHMKLKHLAIHYHFFREKVELNGLDVKFISSKDLVVDLFMNDLSRPSFEYLYSNLNIQVPLHLRRVSRNMNNIYIVTN